LASETLADYQQKLTEKSFYKKEASVNENLFLQNSKFKMADN